MRRLVALLGAVVLVASLAGSSVAAAPTFRVNHVVGNFDLLDSDGSTILGHVVIDYREPTDMQVVPGTLDVTWRPDGRFPYDDAFAVRESHTVLMAAWFGPGLPNPGQAPFVETGTSGSMCDFGTLGNAVCHDFMVVFQLNPFGDGQDSVLFGRLHWDNSPFESYIVGRGAFHVTYAGPTGS